MARPPPSFKPSESTACVSGLCCFHWDHAQNTVKLAVLALLLAAAAHHGLLPLPTALCYWLNPEIYDAGGLSRRAFPEGFVFGTAASAYQVEGMAKHGGRGPSIWDAFIEVPGK